MYVVFLCCIGEVREFALTLCKYDLRKGDLFVSELGQGVTSFVWFCFFCGIYR